VEGQQWQVEKEPLSPGDSTGGKVQKGRGGGRFETDVCNLKEEITAGDTLYQPGNRKGEGREGGRPMPRTKGSNNLFLGNCEGGKDRRKRGGGSQ